MENQEAKSKWDELVRQLGAEVTPETEQLVEAGPAPPVEPVSRRSRDEGADQPTAAPKRPAAGWDNLANEFGLPSPPEPQAPAVEETVAVTKPVAASRTAGADRPRRERPDGERRERPDKRRESREESRDATHQRREPPERRRRSSNYRDERERREEDARAAESPQPKHEAAPPTRPMREEPRPEPVEERPKPGPAVSLWHKIFGSPADQSAKLEEISTHADDETATRDAAVEESLLGDKEMERDYDVDQQDLARQRDEFESGSEPDLDREARDEGQRRPRRSRRRRRGRGGKDESGFEAEHRAGRRQHRSDELQQGGDDPERSADDDDEIEFEAALESSADDAVDTDDVEGDENGNQRSARSRAALQRSIPSWDEAIGFIVDANMQSRPQRRPSGPPGSRGGPSRGRSRGRRRN